MRKRNTSFDITIVEEKVFDKYFDVYGHIKNPFIKMFYKIIFFGALGSGLIPQYKTKKVIFNTKTKKVYIDYENPGRCDNA